MTVVPDTELAPLPPVRSKFLWLDPFSFLKVINASMLAAWAMEVTTWRRPALPDLHKRGPKPTYTDVSVLLMALIQVAWRLSYEEVVDYVRARPNLALFIGCPVAADGHGVSSASATIGRDGDNWASGPFCCSSSAWSGS
jgi:hypothetical protein